MNYYGSDVPTLWTNIFFLFPLALLLFNIARSNYLMQICYKHKTQVGEKESSQVVVFYGTSFFSHLLLNPLPPNSLPLSTPFPLPQKFIFTYVFKAFKKVISNRVEVSNPIFLCINVHKSNNKHSLNKRKKKKKKDSMACLKMLACWKPFLIVISFDAGFATALPPRGLGLLWCRVQVGIGLLGDSVRANWA